jgi:hypothetical protein
MYPGGGNFENELMANVPNIGMMQTMYTTTFGNTSFVIQTAQPGQVSGGFPSVPYLSLEALLYQGQASNPQTSPTNIYTGQTAGTQNLGGLTTMNDSVNQQRYLMGYQAGQSGL